LGESQCKVSLKEGFSQQHDAANNGKPLSIPPFPTPGSPGPERFPLTGRGLLDLTGRDVVKGELFPITMGYDDLIWDDDGSKPGLNCPRTRLACETRFVTPWTM
jgi:hypothetical protein